MAQAGSAYVVRDDRAGTASGNIDKLSPYTLQGLTETLEEARFRSYAGPLQVVLAMGEVGLRPVRRYEHGKEIKVEDRPS